MTQRKDYPEADQTAMFDPEPVANTTAGAGGRHQAAMNRAISAAKRDGHTTEVDEGLTTLLQAGAWALDRFEKENRAYGPSKMLDPIREALHAAGMTPEARADRAGGSDTDAAILELTRALGQLDDAPAE